ncbi:serine/threonine-protein kinase TNNI3K-like [Pecten maximus]|uniref:serine/threonine-protein kinase TNNI3K-like n=1 Tax=Pecten maximus TaxID=6579 RepID=UPI001458497E|nr:serine/threonine-protein kinase TNNI3K-like [Pecten maximus]
MPSNIQSYDWITFERERYPILWSAYSGDLAGLQRQLVNVKDVTGVKDTLTETSILGWAVVGDQVTIIKYLVDRYPKLLTLGNKFDSTPLFLCSVSGNVDMFKLLAAKGLSAYKRISYLCNVLMLTVARGHLELTRHIVNTYPDMLRKTSTDKMDVFLYSCYSGSIEMFNYMLQLNFDPRVSDIDGMNCLMIAAYCGHDLLLRYILDNAARLSIDIDKTDANGNTAISYAMLRNHQDITAILKAYGARDPEVFFKSKQRPSEDKPELTIDDYLRLFSGPTEKYRHIRVVFVGPENVGKTTLCLRLQKKDVDISVRHRTLGAELFLQLYEIGWDSKRWTELNMYRPEVVIHKRLAGMLKKCSSDIEVKSTVISQRGDGTEPSDIEVKSTVISQECVDTEPSDMEVKSTVISQ